MLPFKDEVDPKHTALIVIDVQNDFCHRDGGICRRGKDVSLMQAMVPNLSEFITKARENEAAIVFVRSANGAWLHSKTWLERMKVTDDEDYLVRENSWGAGYYLVQPEPGDRIVVKPRYSAFYGTDLDVVLRARGINTLLMTGVTTNVCVETSSRDGFQRDYNIVLVENCCAATNIEDHLAALRNIKNHFGRVANSDDVVSAWSGQHASASARRF